MADDADNANVFLEKHIEENIKMTLSNNPDKLVPIQECYYCGEEFEKDSIRLFCDGDHASKYENKRSR